MTNVRSISTRKVRHRTGRYSDQGECYFHRFMENYGEDRSLVPMMAVIERPDGVVEYWDAEYVVFLDTESEHQRELSRQIELPLKDKPEFAQKGNLI